jgi:hypothetical protein
MELLLSMVKDAHSAATEESITQLEFGSSILAASELVGKPSGSQFSGTFHKLPSPPLSQVNVSAGTLTTIKRTSDNKNITLLYIIHLLKYFKNTN